ncbi:hypothetical protein BCV71DRAFT_232942 [Rhizopus microsporus]|uniref:Uncharacterized protein n=1 Tax=Rhizopus microsporus TaxID=58291 RepID=A0A1X0S941_RHIZD|nr:hypothetical protein BCV71DRAFT_232942 [Rhizopus microsporus]
MFTAARLTIRLLAIICKVKYESKVDAHKQFQIRDPQRKFRATKLVEKKLAPFALLRTRVDSWDIEIDDNNTFENQDLCPLSLSAEESVVWRKDCIVVALSLYFPLLTDIVGITVMCRDGSSG